MTQEQVHAHQRRVSGAQKPVDKVFHDQPKRKTKFNNIRCTASDGRKFASRLEMRYYEQLLLRWKAGDVLWWVRQPSFELEGGVVYRADFLIVDSKQEVSVVDTKGYATQVSLNKLKQVEARYGLKVQLVREV